MNDTPDIDALLQGPLSHSVGRQLVEWANATRKRIARGDMAIGILSVDEVAKIATAYQTAAQNGTRDAWVQLAWWYAMPDFGIPNIESAEAAMRAGIAANADHAKLGLVKIRWFFQRATATEVQQREAFHSVFEMVQSTPTNAEAVYYLALFTTHGFGVAASPTNGFELQQRASELGNADAMFELFIHYNHGLGVTADERAAYEACRRAANAGHSRAMYNMGASNASGRGMPKNIPEAIQWYERAADVGNPSAMAGLAMIYATGDGVEPDREYAAQLFDQADYCGLDVSDLRKTVGL